MLFDTHAHLNDEKFEEDREEVIARAQEAGVSRIINVGFNRKTIQETLQLVEKYDFIYAAIGWHPQEAKNCTDQDLEWIRQLATENRKVVALGEMGLDYYWDTSPKDVQKELFRKQICLAKELALPIVIHDRDAHEDVIQILKEENAGEVGGVLHCFSGDEQIMEEALNIGFYIGLDGPVTFKNGHLAKEIAKLVPEDRLLIETDCPYLAPHPYRGKRNESAYVRLVAEEIARLREVSIEQIAQITMENANRLFQLPDENIE